MLYILDESYALGFSITIQSFYCDVRPKQFGFHGEKEITSGFIYPDSVLKKCLILQDKYLRPETIFPCPKAVSSAITIVKEIQGDYLPCR
jgi:hypothetical protein